MAIVCHDWAYWAFDARWRNCEVPFQELLKTLCPVPLVTLGLHRTAIRLEMRASFSNVTASQWELFVKRSGLISSLRISGTALSPSSITLLKELRLHYGGVLFRSLRHLSLEFEPDGVDARTAKIAAVPSVQTVNLRTDCFSDAEVFVRGLPQQSPHIRSMHIVSDDYGDGIVGLPLQTSLRIFSYSAPLISRVAWKALKQCTWLVKLSLSEEGADFFGLDEIEAGLGTEPVDFPNLQQLDLRLPEARAITLVILYTSPP
ncbi:hypothetical protein M407DRAFT_225591 [Tulasnella calospora MUT 4182]|uniref:F-box domain-containing protein n=1 Tax=Tulasnella calospora MUT 4182 TaxID=1051891 RepID=A0A0C3LAF8_9AGAM|nr:hypothetical protein M407DRAFT_225591 [Tulasnella calospora MUT 4182]